jgi:hypothetical protein
MTDLRIRASTTEDDAVDDLIAAIPNCNRIRSGVVLEDERRK